jgi:hypothetical protein
MYFDKRHELGRWLTLTWLDPALKGFIVNHVYLCRKVVIRQRFWSTTSTTVVCYICSGVECKSNFNEKYSIINSSSWLSCTIGFWVMKSPNLPCEYNVQILSSPYFLTRPNTFHLICQSIISCKATPLFSQTECLLSIK